MRYIDDDDIQYTILNKTGVEKQGVWEDVINKTPTTDVVEVVRCKDCKYWLPHYQLGFDEENNEYHDYCSRLIPDDEWYAFTRSENDFCSYGERGKYEKNN